MKLLIDRTPQEGVEHHRKNPVRVYSEDPIQKSRIVRSREMVQHAIWDLSGPVAIIEPGCGTSDVCGPLYVRGEVVVYGFDCNEACVREAKRRYPDCHYDCRTLDDFDDTKPWACPEIVVLCELLEHVTEPVRVAKSFLERSSASVISHPLDEKEGSSLSGGDHSWSLSMDDHRNFFKAGGHKIVESETFEQGGYRIVLSRGVRV